MTVTLDFSKLQLPFQPQVLTAILQLKEDTSMNFRDLDNLIRSDQNMTTLLLKVANSSFYSRGNEIRTLQQAIGLLGFRTVLSLASAASAKFIFETGNYTRFKRYVWEHSVITAIIARTLSEHLSLGELEEEAFIAGLLHDIGKVILNVIDQKKFIEVLHRAEDEGRPFFSVEQEMFGMDHTQAGRLCTAHWKLPRLYQLVAAGHESHNDLPEGFTQEEKIVLDLVGYANHLAKRYGYGLWTGSDEERGQRYIDALSINPETVDFFTETYPGMVKENRFYQFFTSVV